MSRHFDVFVSYRTDDRVLAAELVEDLRGVGLNVWVDWEQVAPAEDWLAALHRGLEVSDTALVLIGSSTLGDWQRKEVGQALVNHVARGSRVLAVLLPGVRKPTRLFPFLDLNEWVSCDDVRGSFRGSLDRIIWGVTGMRQLAQRTIFGEEYALTISEGAYRTREISILPIVTLRDERLPELTWSMFGVGMERLVAQVRNYGYRITCDACIGINEMGLIIGATLNGTVLGGVPMGYVKARWSRGTNVHILPESVLPELRPNPVLFLATFEIKEGNAVTAVVRHLRERYQDPEIYYLVFAALTDTPHAIVDSLSDLVAFQKIARLSLTDVFVAATVNRPGANPPQGLR